MAEAAGKEEVATATIKDKTDDTDAAESSKGSPPQPGKDGGRGEEEEEEEMECAVCLQKCVHPVKLPCSHIFCFLCVKGVANQSKRCAMCRQEIPADFLDHPTLLAAVEGEKEEVLPGGYQWFYEGRNGWWRYDQRTNSDLEGAYSEGVPSVRLMIAGNNYDIDFTDMKQARTGNTGLSRRIKRDTPSKKAKGTAGLSSKALSGRKGQGGTPRRGRKRKLKNDN